MLRASLRSSRALAPGSVATRSGRQWQSLRASGALVASQRTYADDVKPSIKDSRSAVLPGSASPSTTVPPPPGPVSSTITPATPSSSTIPPENVPLTPPPPPATPAEPKTPSPPPPPPPKKPRRFFRRLLYTIIFFAAAYGGGVYYSRVNDNFHDFFTEYIPFGEEAVLYFEEKEFRKRFPPMQKKLPRDMGAKVTIPSQSGVSWKVADPTNNHHDATSSEPKAKESLVPAAVSAAKKDTPPPQPKAEPASAPSAPTAPTPKVAEKGSKEFKAPEVDEPSRFPPEVTRIDPIKMAHADEPLIQELAKILNDIITVVNADNANKRFSATITKAKDDVKKIGDKIQELKAETAKEVEKEVTKSHRQFDEAAVALVKRLEGEMQEVEAKWREEFENERQRLEQSFEDRLKNELERAKQLYDQRLDNQLLEQALAMKREFITDVKTRVEEERSARLGKLAELSSSVSDLEKLTTDWNGVLDNNLKTQHLHVAVEAVRANLEKAQVPKPFVKELAALKEIAADDTVVNAAIASINPTAYQRGIPNTAQLIDRFRRVATEVRKASLLPEEAGVASHASSYVLSKFMFKKKGLADGSDVESILTRTETLLEEGDLDSAAREMNSLTGWAKTLSKDWLGEVRKVLEVQQALDVIATEARLQSLRVQ